MKSDFQLKKIMADSDEAPVVVPHAWNQQGCRETSHSLLPAEYPLSVSYNGISHAVMMVTPRDIDDFVYGFTLSERIIQSPVEIHDVQIECLEEALFADIHLSNRAAARLGNHKRQLSGRTGCGICGIENLSQAIPALTAGSASPYPSLAQLIRVREESRRWQELSKISGAVHAAFLIDTRGHILDVREDIGRHNALDKLIGHVVKSRLNPQNLGVLMTSRCSIELVQKISVARLGTLITLGAPTSFSVKQAKEANLNLIHLPRSDAPRFYHLSK
ncbi:formate dehydrogenase accessory sulfurtransferase FdhD [Parasalinivibrio latis]|uniref:formate dehydrogenase accessory sulfurtransferase FdhD n=1 Tax=Parasalinivibrio latis TaxID=2952610 RepID=UPI0030E47CA3